LRPLFLQTELLPKIINALFDFCTHRDRAADNHSARIRRPRAAGIPNQPSVPTAH
jgi:hypothetical protein